VRLRVITQVVNVSEIPAPWNWLADRFTRDPLIWQSCSAHAEPGPARTLRLPRKRLHAATTARSLIRAHPGRSVVVSHSVYPALYVEAFTQPHRFGAVHLAFAFNFATLPTGIRRLRFSRNLQRIDRFVVASTVEREVYSEYFDIAPERFDLLLWSMRPPTDECFRPARFGTGQYICAIGSQGRDYDTLINAMWQLPAANLVLVTGSGCLPISPIPSNVRMLIDIPLADALNVLAHSSLMVLPLESGTTLAGHVTIVSALHMGKAIVATRSTGVQDYLADGETALLVAARDASALAAGIDRLLNDTALTDRLRERGVAFARANCSEQSAVDYFHRFLIDQGLGSERLAG
jgi:glycosyltransferase involved in cell wall biosynthesis